MANNSTTVRRREDAMFWATAFELAASIVENCSSVDEAAATLEAQALRLRRTWSAFPVAANGEREYRSWSVTHGK
jgi:hypothetical protein